MFKRLLLVAVVVGSLIAAPFVFGAFAAAETSSPCACCEDCICEDCTCDALGCDCKNGGPCACAAACCTACCAKP